MNAPPSENLFVRRCLFSRLFQLLVLHGAYLGGKAEQIDEAFRIVMVVQVAGGEGSDGLVVQGIGRGGPGLDNVALVQLELHFAGHIFLGLLDEGLHRLAQRGEPFSFVYDLSEFVAHVQLHGGGLAVQNQLLQLLMRLVEDGSAGSLIDAAGLHAHNAVFHDIHDADAVLSAQLVEFADDIGNLHLLSVDGGGGALFKGHGHIFRFVGSLLGRGAQNQEMVVIGLVGGILKLQPFVADVPEVAVPAVAGICGEGQVDAVGSAVFDLGFAGIQRPLVVSPGCDDPDIGSQGLDAKLETDLVVALSGSPRSMARSPASMRPAFGPIQPGSDPFQYNRKKVL